MTNLEIVQDAYAKFGSGDIAGLINHCAEDITWQSPEIENASFGGKVEGHEGVGKFFAGLVADEEITLFDVNEFIDGGEKIVVLGRSASNVRATGKTYACDWIHVFTVKNGKITDFLEMFDNAAATRAFQKSATA